MKQARILVIEDDSDTADMLKIFFSSQGSSVEIAPTGNKALSIVRRFQPDLILLDIVLPDMDGYAVCQKLRSSLHTRAIPILFLTQKNTRSDLLAGLEIGADDYLTKPFDLEELKLRVRNALRRSQTYRQIDARTSLPTGELIRTRLAQLLTKDDWGVLLVRISGFERLRTTGGYAREEELLRCTTAWLEQLLQKVDYGNPFIGYLSAGDYILITDAIHVFTIHEACADRQPSSGAPTERPAGQSYQMELKGWRSAAEPPLELALITADDGPFEDVSQLLEALFDALGSRRDAVA